MCVLWRGCLKNRAECTLILCNLLNCILVKQFRAVEQLIFDVLYKTRYLHSFCNGAKYKQIVRCQSPEKIATIFHGYQFIGILVYLLSHCNTVTLQLFREDNARYRRSNLSAQQTCNSSTTSLRKSWVLTQFWESYSTSLRFLFMILKFIFSSAFSGYNK